jgi:hypothetical protein
MGTLELSFLIEWAYDMNVNMEIITYYVTPVIIIQVFVKYIVY